MSISDLGSTLSTMFGDHKSVEIVQEKISSATGQSLEHYRSPTTNSYNKCLDSMRSNFPVEVYEIAKKVIIPHDQNNFNETVNLGTVEKFNPDTGKKYVAGTHFLRMIGKYEFKWFAHCKTIEMWIEFQKN